MTDSIPGKRIIQIGLQNRAANSDSLYDAFHKIRDNFDILFKNASPFTNVVGANGISVTANTQTGTMTIQNTGVTNIIEGRNITINRSNGNITINATSEVDWTAAYANVAYSVAGANVIGEVANAAYANTSGVAFSVDASNVVGIVTNAYHANVVDAISPGPQLGITAIGTLDFLNVNGDITARNANLGNAVVANYYAGVLTTPSQPNITQVGTLTSLAVTGTSNLNNISNVTITGGTAGQYLKTDGTGVLSWGNVLPAGTNMQIQFNDSGALAGSNLTFNKTSNTTYVPGDVLPTHGLQNLMYSWGTNNNGMMGINQPYMEMDFSNPVQVDSTGPGWKVLSHSKGWNQMSGVKIDGTLWTWGLNFKGKLGLGDTTDRSSPTQVGTLTTWSMVSSGDESSIALKTDGTIWTWGINSYGELGLGDSGLGTERSSPVQVGTLTDWAFVCAGWDHMLAVKTNGTLWSWGYNWHGQLGLGDSGVGTGRSSPVQVGTLTDWSTVYIGKASSFALKTDRTLWAWGRNVEGELGLGDTIARNSPVLVGVYNDWVSFASNWTHAVGIRADGTLWTWGVNGNGQLGLSDTTQRLYPAQVGTLNNWKYAATGNYASAAIKTDGTLWTWGINFSGTLGLGDSIGRSSPTQVGTDTNWSMVTMNQSATFATKLVDLPVLVNIGNNLYTVESVTAKKLTGTIQTSVQPYINTVGALTTTTFNSHLLPPDPVFGTWITGSHYYATDYRITSSPVQVSSTRIWNRIDAVNGYAIEIGTDALWSLKTMTQLYPGTTWATLATVWSNNLYPPSTMLAIKTDGTLWGWGDNWYGQLGLGDTVARSSPVQVGTLTDWQQVCIGSGFSAAIKTNGTLWTWGGNYQSELGLGDAISRSSPVQVGTDINWSKVAAGCYHVMAVKTDGTLWAWGFSAFGQLGLGATGVDVSSPTQVGLLTDWSSVACGDMYTVATKVDGTLWTWGDNGYGQLGHGDYVARSSPTQVGSLTGWSDIVAGPRHVLGINNSKIYGWGVNTQGELGTSTSSVELSPIPLSLQSGFPIAATIAASFFYGQYTIGGLIGAPGTPFDTVYSNKFIGKSLKVDSITGGFVMASATGVNAADSYANVLDMATVTTTTVDSWSATTYRSSKYLVQISQGANHQVSELLVIHNGTVPSLIEYGILETAGALGNITSNIVGGLVNIQVTMLSAAPAKITISRTSLFA